MAYKIVDAEQLDADLTTLADAIRAKSGNTELLSFPDGMAAEVEAVYEAGKKAEYDAFWDTYQNYGKRTDYSYAFRDHWNASIFRPKYDMRPEGDNGAIGMFVYLGLTTGEYIDLGAALAHNGVVLDFSQATRLNSVFDRCNITNIPPIDVQSCTNLMMAFYNSNYITKLVINNIREDCAFDRTFFYCKALVELTVTGIIGQNGFSVAQSPLNKPSITSIINALSTTTSGLTVTLSLAAVNTAFETSEGAADGSASDEWLALAATKSNWTISLV